MATFQSVVPFSEKAARHGKIVSEICDMIGIITKKQVCSWLSAREDMFKERRENLVKLPLILSMGRTS